MNVNIIIIIIIIIIPQSKSTNTFIINQVKKKRISCYIYMYYICLKITNWLFIIYVIFILKMAFQFRITYS